MRSFILLAALLVPATLFAQTPPLEKTPQSWVVSPSAAPVDFRPDLYLYGTEWTGIAAASEGDRRPVGLALLGSLVLPGAGQALNHQWIKSGVFVTLEALAVYGHVKNLSLGRDLERSYWDYVETGWSPAKYLGFMVDYHNHYYPNNRINYNDYATPGSNVAAIIQSGNYAANARQEWTMIDLAKLRQLEAITLYGGTAGLAFSHNLPDYGSQQYYELVSKYFQFGPGWKDFMVGVDQVNWEKAGMSDAWFDGAARSKRFNDRLRTARNMMSLIFVNHVVSGVDALFSAKLHNHRLETAFSPMDGGTLHLSIRF